MNCDIYLDPKFLRLGSNICHNKMRHHGYGGMEFTKIWKYFAVFTLVVFVKVDINVQMLKVLCVFISIFEHPQFVLAAQLEWFSSNISSTVIDLKHFNMKISLPMAA